MNDSAMAVRDSRVNLQNVQTHGSKQFGLISTRQRLNSPTKVFDTIQLFQISPGILGIFKGKDGKNYI